MSKILEMKVDALMRLVASEDETNYAKAKADVLRLMRNPLIAGSGDSVTDMIEEVLTHMGMPNAILGFDYAVESIRLAVEDKDYINNITKRLYPTIAETFDTTPTRAERAIRHAIETTWDRGDWEVFGAYFGSSIDADKGKPTNSEFIARLANMIRRTRGAA